MLLLRGADGQTRFLLGREQTVQSPEFLELKELMGISNNFSKYRRAVRDANPPLVPYLGRFLTDLNFIEDANKIRISANNHVNFRTRPPPPHCRRRQSAHANSHVSCTRPQASATWWRT